MVTKGEISHFASEMGYQTFILLRKIKVPVFYDLSARLAHDTIRPMNIQNEHQRCSSLYDLSASLAHDTIENGHKVPVFNVHGSS
jgi:hypothetical protein